MLFPDLSLRWKIPLRVLGAVVGTAVAVTAALVVREYDEMRQSVEGHAKSVGRLLADTLVTPLIHNDTWRAYEILLSARDTSDIAPALRADIVIVTTANHQVFVSTRPREFPIGSGLAERGGEYALVRAALTEGSAMEQRVVEPAESPLYFVTSPLVADGTAIGHVILGYSNASFTPRFIGLVERILLVTMLVLAVLMPVSWILARRTGEPLMRLAEPMRQIPGELDAVNLDALPKSGDEIGQLSAVFARMVTELRQKQQMERQMLVSERLAALGRLTAGIAHEINNPLAGMLTAIKVYRRHGDGDPMALNTMSLLERGLTQIRHTVGALLVETKIQDRPIAPEDIDDLLILVKAEAHARGIRVNAHGSLLTPLPLPATLMRQIVLNLLLNAVEAAAEGGHVDLHVAARDGRLALAVENDGQYIPQDRIAYLFEPLAGSSPKGHGLGLWIVYQIVQQLGGEITVESEPGSTTFSIDIPYGESIRNPAAALSR